MTNFDDYQKMTENIKDMIMDENRKLRRQLSEKEQSFELVKSVHYDKSIDLHILNDIIVGCTGCLYSIIFYKDFEITNMQYSNPLFSQVMKNKKTILAHQEDMFVTSEIIPEYTIVMYNIKASQILEDSNDYIKNIILLFPNKYINEDVLELVRSFMGITEVLINIVLTREKMVELIETDALTGLLNRSSWNRHLESMRKYQARQFMLFIDVDNFKNINDTFGHEKGDEVLKFVAVWLKNAFRILDKCFRLGGDEFCVIGKIEDSYQEEFLCKLHTINSAFRKATNIFMKMDFTISIGVLIMNEYPTDKNVYAIIDGLLYKSKNEGKDRINIVTI